MGQQNPSLRVGSPEPTTTKKKKKKKKDAGDFVRDGMNDEKELHRGTLGPSDARHEASRRTSPQKFATSAANSAGSSTYNQWSQFS